MEDLLRCICQWIGSIWHISHFAKAFEGAFVSNAKVTSSTLSKCCSPNLISYKMDKLFSNVKVLMELSVLINAAFFS